MAKSLKLAYSVTSKLVSGSSTKLVTLPRQSGKAFQQSLFGVNGGASTSSRAHSTLSQIATRPVLHTRKCACIVCRKNQAVFYSTEVEKEVSKFLSKEIQYEASKSAEQLPKIPGFEITTEGSDVTLTKTSGAEKIVVKLNVNGAVDSVESDDASQQKDDEPPQIVCRPPFHVEITKGNTVFALQCAFPSAYPDYEEGQYEKRPEDEQIDDQFEIQEVAIHSGEWKDTTYTVSAETMDAELFDLLMDLLDERGINDEFIAHLVDFCTAYENKQYVSFLQSLKSFVEK